MAQSGKKTVKPSSQSVLSQRGRIAILLAILLIAAAAMLAFNSWHLQISRLGAEASLSPLLLVGSLASLLWANLLLGDDDGERRANLLSAALAGLMLGLHKNANRDYQVRDPQGKPLWCIFETQL